MRNIEEFVVWIEATTLFRIEKRMMKLKKGKVRIGVNLNSCLNMKIDEQNIKHFKQLSSQKSFTHHSQLKGKSSCVKTIISLF